MLCLVRTAVNWAFVLRGSGLAIGALFLLAAGAMLWLGQAFPSVPYAQPPAAPAILAPRGELPADPAALQLWVRRDGEAERLAGSAFLLVLPDGQAVGVTAAHNLAIGHSGQLLDEVTLRIAKVGEAGGGSGGEAGGGIGAGDVGSGAGIQIAGLHGAPGRPRRFGLDLSTDYALLVLEGEPPGQSLEPDPRGAAQAGERILLLGGADGRRYEGVVFQSDPQGIWCLIQAGFDPSRMSGSPAVSLHTGKVIGMAVVAGWRGGRLVLGLDPIGSLIEKGMSDEP